MDAEEKLIADLCKGMPPEEAAKFREKMRKMKQIYCEEQTQIQEQSKVLAQKVRQDSDFGPLKGRRSHAKAMKSMKLARPPASRLNAETLQIEKEELIDRLHEFLRINNSLTNDIKMHQRQISALTVQLRDSERAHEIRNVEIRNLEKDAKRQSDRIAELENVITELKSGYNSAAIDDKHFTHGSMSRISSFPSLSLLANASSTSNLASSSSSSGSSSIVTQAALYGQQDFPDNQEPGKDRSSSVSSNESSPGSLQSYSSFSSANASQSPTRTTSTITTLTTATATTATGTTTGTLGTAAGGAVAGSPSPSSNSSTPSSNASTPSSNSSTPSSNLQRKDDWNLFRKREEKMKREMDELRRTIANLTSGKEAVEAKLRESQEREKRTEQALRATENRVHSLRRDLEQLSQEMRRSKSSTSLASSSVTSLLAPSSNISVIESPGSDASADNLAVAGGRGGAEQQSSGSSSLPSTQQQQQQQQQQNQEKQYQSPQTELIDILHDDSPKHAQDSVQALPPSIDSSANDAMQDNASHQEERDSESTAVVSGHQSLQKEMASVAVAGSPSASTESRSIAFEIPDKSNRNRAPLEGDGASTAPKPVDQKAIKNLKDTRTLRSSLKRAESGRTGASTTNPTLKFFTNLTAALPISQKPKVVFDLNVLILDACLEGDIEAVRSYLNKNIGCIDAATAEGLTGLHNACIEGHVAIVKELVTRGARVNVADDDGWSPLHSAACFGNIEIVKTLVEIGGASLLMRDNEGKVPLGFATEGDIRSYLTAAMDRRRKAKKLFALFDRTPEDLDELPLAENEEFTILTSPEHRDQVPDVEEADWRDPDFAWWEAKSIKSGRAGWVPSNYLGEFKMIASASKR